MKNQQNKIQNEDGSEKKQWKIFGWFFLLFGILLLIDGIIKLFFNITWIGWSIQSQHETYNNGWYFILLGSMFTIGAVLRIRNQVN